MSLFITMQMVILLFLKWFEPKSSIMELYCGDHRLFQKHFVKFELQIFLLESFIFFGLSLWDNLIKLNKRHAKLYIEARSLDTSLGNDKFE